MASDTGVLEDAADILDLVHKVSSNIERCLSKLFSAVKTKSISILQQVGEISTRMAALTDKINVCNAVLDDLKGLKVLVEKSLPDVYLKSQPEPGEPLPKSSP